MPNLVGENEISRGAGPILTPIELYCIAKEIRRRTIKSIYQAQSGQLGSTLSCIEILTVLFFHQMNTETELRDRFILSKGQAAPSLYATLSLKGFISEEQLSTLCTMGSPLQGRPVKDSLPYMDASTGSLGQGLSIGIGYALSSRLHNEKRRVFVLLGDGELQEGQNWEAAMCAAKFGLDNLVAIVDYNKFQNNGTIKETMPIETLVEKYKAFGWNVRATDGHNMEELIGTLQHVRANGQPWAIIAHTKKGKGISFIEEDLNWFCKTLEKDDFELAMKELS